MTIKVLEYSLVDDPISCEHDVIVNILSMCVTYCAIFYDVGLGQGNGFSMLYLICC